MAYLLSKCLLFLFAGLAFPRAEDPSSKVTVHPFYVSVTEINQNAAEKSLEISCKFFADDFEQTLEKAYKTQLDISSDKDKAFFDKFIPDYIAKHFGLTVDGKPVKLNYVGYEKEKESVYCYFELTSTPNVKRLDITSNLLYELTQEQINIMHITVNGKRQSSKLSYPDVKAAFQF
ncbi:MAG: hypothetical protein EOO10_12475 [Chitinophagaceae bacterium]|nr:MAG: hypothetical protein EOO10_12475 [Chitinophagaceae bacterium]